MLLAHIDAFIDQPLTGNPAAVILLDREVDPAWMQSIAAEMNLSESVFLRKREEPSAYDIRWFAPGAEVDLCGHATLASAHFLFEQGIEASGSTLSFHSRKKGVLLCSRDGDRIAMDFPSVPAAAVEPPEGLLPALGIQEPEYVATNGMDYLIVVGDQNTVRSAKPDFAALKNVRTRGTILTAPGTDGYDCVSRFFCPGIGVDEDPVTGSAHCCLGPYWAQRLGKAELDCYQASARGGILGVQVRGDRTRLLGRAGTVFIAQLSPALMP